MSTQTAFRRSARRAICARGIIATALLALGALLSQAAAAETTRYPGTICKARHGSQAGDFNYYESGIRNNSGNTRWVSCPVPRQIAWYSGSYQTTIWAYVSNGGGTLYCEGYNVNSTTGSITDSHSTKTSASGNQSLAMLLDAPGGAQNVVRCLLPPHSYVRSLFVYEPE